MNNDFDAENGLSEELVPANTANTIDRLYALGDEASKIPTAKEWEVLRRSFLFAATALEHLHDEFEACNQVDPTHPTSVMLDRIFNHTMEGKVQ